MRRRVGLLACLIAATASAAPAAPSRVPGSFVEARAEPLAGSAPARWWAAFADPQLDALIARGVRDNPDIAVAQARLAQARAAVREARADRLPRLAAVADVAEQSGTLVTASGDSGSLFELGARASWEPDLFGRLGKTARAARLDAKAAAARAAEARLLVQTEIAATYFALRSLDAEREAAAAAEGSAAQTLAILEGRERAGTLSPVELDRRRRDLAPLHTDRLAIERERATTLHALALLVGAESLPALAPEPALLVPVVPAGLPSAMLARRPDVAAAIDAVEAARLRHRVAKTAWFPHIALTGNGGQASTSLASLLGDTARTFGFNLLLSLPIFDGGRNTARVAAAAADLDLATAEQRATILAAFREVEDALSTLRLLAEEDAVAREAAAAAARTRATANRRFDSGAISRLDLLEATRLEVAARGRAARLAHARAAAAVRLIRALGGGWGDAPAPALDLAALDRH